MLVYSFHLKYKNLIKGSSGEGNWLGRLLSNVPFPHSVRSCKRNIKYAANIINLKNIPEPKESLYNIYFFLVIKRFPKMANEIFFQLCILISSHDDHELLGKTLAQSPFWKGWVARLLSKVLFQ